MTTVRIDKATLDFFTAECDQIHALCDRANVPRELDGSALSMAQRVAVLEGVCQNAIAQWTGVPVPPVH